MNCTCPRLATRTGLVRNGTSALCPTHGAPPRIMTATPKPEPVPAFEGVRYCEECGRQHAAVRCDFVDEN